VRRWRPALRIARRSVRRNPGRSLLIAVLVALPVAGATMVDVLARTLSSTERDAFAAMGAADAEAVVTSYSTIDFRPGHGFGNPAMRARADRDPAGVDLEALLPPGSRAVRAPERRDTLVRSGDRVRVTTLVIADAREPLHAHEARLDEGRAPTQPHEVLLTPALAERLGDLRPGASITLTDGPALTVTGLAYQRSCLDCSEVIAAPGSTAAQFVDGPVDASEVRYFVDLARDDAGVDLWPALAKQGVALTPRDAYLQPDRYGYDDGVTSVESLQTVAMVILIAGLGLLEVVLLAGTAFAVGARRQTRELGLVGATGGTARDVRRIVLAQGLVLGALGAVIGVATGAALVVAGRPLWQELDSVEITSWAFGPWEIAGAALIGLLSGLGAAVVPAVGAARMRPVDALAERFRTTRRARRRATAAGGALVTVGAVLALAGDRQLADDFAAYARALAAVRETGEYVNAPAPVGPVSLIVAGATLLVAGIVVLAPALIVRLARVAARLPLSPRLAFRDAARHRHRTGPATSAIAVAVAGSVVLAFLAAGAVRRDEARHIPALPPHVLAIDRGDADVATARRGARAAVETVPGAQAHVVRRPLRPLAKGESAPPDMPGFELYPMHDSDAEGCLRGCSFASGALAMAGSDELNAILAGGRLDDEARAALAGGRAVVFDRRVLSPDGRVRVETGWDEGAEKPRTVALPARLAERRPYESLPWGLVPQAVARRQGWETAPSSVLVSLPASAARQEIEAAQAAAVNEGATAHFEDGPDVPGEAILLAISAIAAFVTLVGVAISVALSAAEGRADLATLAAVGAPPRRRRALAASQALLVGGLGCALGVGFGTFVAYTARATTGAPEFAIPWGNLAVTALVVPLLAVLVATVFTPSRLPLMRRVT
jgi:putative ABC transport system permease protein